MLLNRELAKSIANKLGYFWLPCPICGEDFAGFEWGKTIDLTIGTGEGVCEKPECGEEAERRNADFRATLCESCHGYGHNWSMAVRNDDGAITFFTCQRCGGSGKKSDAPTVVDA